MGRYILFIYERHYPHGGMRDAVMSSDNFEDCMRFYKDLVARWRSEPDGDSKEDLDKYPYPENVSIYDSELGVLTVIDGENINETMCKDLIISL